ncbi:MAG: PEGA domain-containing protein [bacterium]
MQNLRPSRRSVYIGWFLALALLASIVFLFLLPEFLGDRSPSAPEAVVSISTQASPIETTMVTIDSSKQTVPQPSAALPEVGTVRIDSKPGGAAILLDGKPFGVTPRTIENVTTGNHNIVLKKAGYQDYSVSIIVVNGATNKIDAPLLPLVGKLRVVVKPAGAIYIDGERKRENASDPFEINLSAGPHLIKVDHPEFGYWEKLVDIKSDSVHAIEVDFTKFVNVTIAVTSGWAEIYVDGKATGRHTTAVVSLRVGKHTIEVRREGYIMEDGAKEINVEEGNEEHLLFTLMKKP